MDLSAFDFKADGRAAIEGMARTAEGAERYEDMCVLMIELVNLVTGNDEALNVGERNLLSVAFKNVIGTRRASWRTLSASSEAETEGSNLELLKVYKASVEEELKATCGAVLNLLIDKLIPSENKDDEASVFYLKMAGDYYRYLAESTPSDDNDKKSATYYEKAYDVAQKTLKPTHPIRLGLALNYSVCHYEILKNKSKACELAKSAFDEAISKLDKLEESDYKDSTLIMQLLRDNLTLWTSSNADDEAVQVEEISDEEN